MAAGAPVVRFLERIARQPTAPFHEERVAAESESIARSYGARVRRDAYGNLVVSPPSRRNGPEIWLVAHMDHPGLEIVGPREAQLLGGLAARYFRRGTRLRFYHDGEPVAAKVRSYAPKTQRMRLDAGLGLSRLRRGDMGVFDLTDFEVVRGHVHARQLDDLAGCAVSLAVMERVCRDRRLNVRVLLTRAEEIGFGGALGAAADGLIPKRAWIISVEASKALPGVEIGGGPVIRVGDRAKTFDPLAENLLGAARTRLPKSQPVQRFLMSGGTCEATVFAVFGYHATGVAIPLGNYHNQGPGNRLAPEIVSVKDLSTAVNLIETASRNVPAGLGRDELLKGRILRYLRRYGPRLRRTSGADRNP